jgi:hypothetical protein
VLFIACSFSGYLNHHAQCLFDTQYSGAAFKSALVKVKLLYDFLRLLAEAIRAH